jgi:hypothetical protein
MHINRRIKDFLEATEQKTKQESKKRNQEYTENLYFQNISCLDSFITRAKPTIEEQAFMQYTTREELQDNIQEYQNFLAFRKEFSEKYENTVYQTYEILFKSDPTIDSFFYNSILSELRRLGDVFSLKMSDAQFFLGAKKKFSLRRFLWIFGQISPWNSKSQCKNKSST